jgi:hypothetical protein
MRFNIALRLVAGLGFTLMLAGCVVVPPRRGPPEAVVYRAPPPAVVYRAPPPPVVVVRGAIY